jgi:hypothetical protein
MPPSEKKPKIQSLLKQQRPAPAQPAATVVTIPAERVAPYPLSTGVAPDLIILPDEAHALPAPLQEIARHYITARRRTGEAILDAARWIFEARQQADHGQWLLFLRVVGTSSDSADQFRYIHEYAQQFPAFADAVRSGFLNQTAAVTAAKAFNTVKDVDMQQRMIAEILDSDESPKARDVQAIVQRVRKDASPLREIASEQIPIKSEFDSDGPTIIALSVEERRVMNQVLDRLQRLVQTGAQLHTEDRRLLNALVVQIQALNDNMS